MDFPAWAFIHNGSAIVIMAPSLKDATENYFNRWYPDVNELQIIPVIGCGGTE